MKLLNSENFEFFFKQHYSWLCNISFSFLKDHDAAEDVVQEFFTNFWNNKDTLKINGDIKHYMAKAVRNRSLNYLRDKKHFEDINTLDFESNYGYNEQEKDMEYYELIQIVEKAILDLPKKCREVFILSRYERKSYKEISHYLNISEKTVENQISKALKVLREKLKKQHPLKSVFTLLIFFSFIHRGLF